MASGKSIGSIAGMVIGGIVGSVVPGIGTALGASIGGMLGGIAGGIYDTATAPDIVNEQDSIADIMVQTSAFGQAIPQIIGKFRLAGNVIDMTDREEHENREVQPSQGKGGGPRNVTVTKYYTVNLDIALCDTRYFGPIDGIARAWSDNTLIYDQSQNTQFPAGWTLYSGEAIQVPSPVFEAAHGVGEISGYPFLCHLVMEDYDIGYNARVPNFSFEVYQGGYGSESFIMTSVAVSLFDGHIWVAIPSLQEVWRFDASGTLVAKIRLGASAPAATSYGFSIAFTDAAHTWVADPAHYAFWRVLTASNTVPDGISAGSAFLSNQIAAGYVWIGVFLSWQSLDASVIAYDGTSVVNFTYNDSFLAANSWMRLALGADGNLWTFSDGGQSDGLQSQVIRIDHNNADHIAAIDLGINTRPIDIMVSSTGFIWCVDYVSNAIYRVDPSTNLIDATVGTGTHPLQAAEASDGYIWVCSEVGLVTRIHPTLFTPQHFQSDNPGWISPNNNLWARGPSGVMWLCCIGAWTVQRFATTGTALTVRTIDDPRSIVAGTSNSIWVVGSSGEMQQIQDDGTTASAENESIARLQDVIGMLCEAGGLTTSEYDTSGLAENPQVAMAIVNMVAVRGPLENLSVAHNFQVYESGTALAFKTRGTGNVIATIDEEELSASTTGDTDLQGLRITREEEKSLPTTLSFSYTSVKRNYQQNTQNAFVTNSRNPVENNRAVSTNVVITDGQGKKRAQEALDRLWVQRNSFEASVPRAYAALEPMDRIQITSRGVTHAIVLSEVSYGRPGILNLKGFADASAVQNVIGAIPGSIRVPTPGIGVLAQTVGRLLNLPAINTNDQDIRYHIAYEYAATGWPGATLHRSIDSGSSFNQLHGGFIRGITGTTLGTLADANPLFTDTVSTVQVYIIGGQQLTSISNAQLQQGKNACMIANEMVQFRDATLVDTDTYELSYFYRGRRGTERFTDNHSTGDLFVMLDAGIYQIDMELNDRGVERPYKTVTNGLSLAEVTADDFTPTGSNLKLWDVANPDATLDSGSGDWTFTWRFRSRFSAWIDDDEAAPDPDFIRYQLDIFSDGTYGTRNRREQIEEDGDYQSVETFVYTAAMQTTDFGSPQTTLYYKLYQVGTYGHGVKLELVAP